MYCPVCKQEWKNSDFALECCIENVEEWLIERLKTRIYILKGEVEL